MITEQLSTRATRNISSTRSWPTFPLVHDVLNLWCIRVVTGDVSDLSALSIDRLYPLSALQCVILADITGALLYCRDVQHNPASDDDQQSTSWSVYRVPPLVNLVRANHRSSYEPYITPQKTECLSLSLHRWPCSHRVTTRFSSVTSRPMP